MAMKLKQVNLGVDSLPGASGALSSEPWDSIWEIRDLIAAQVLRPYHLMKVELEVKPWTR